MRAWTRIDRCAPKLVVLDVVPVEAIVAAAVAAADLLAVHRCAERLGALRSYASAAAACSSAAAATAIAYHVCDLNHLPLRASAVVALFVVVTVADRVMIAPAMAVLQR